MIDNGTFVAHEDDPKTAKLRARHLGEDYLTKRADVPGGPNPWWFSRLDHTGRPAFNGNSSYKTFRNVWDYGALGNGVADDTKAIQRAISDGNRCGANCAGSTTTGAVVYLPPGVYRISSTLILYFDTQLVGAPGYGSTLKASTSFIGDAIITCDVYLADGTSEWYLNTGNFYRNLRNLEIDLRSATRPKNLMGIHWQVAQAASVESVIIYMGPKSSSSQVGIFAENGSGGWITNILTDGGLYGFLGGNQQYSINGFSAQNAKNGIGLIWDWTWSWTGVVIHDCDVGIDLTANGSSQAEPVGSFVLVDSFFQNVPTIIKTYLSTSNKQQGSTVITVSNTGFRDCGNFILLPNNQVVNPQGGISSTQINYLQIGDMVTHDDSSGKVTRPIELTTSGREGDWYPQRAYMDPGRPHYSTYTDSQILNANLVAKGSYLILTGDGRTDDTAALQALFTYAADHSMLLYIPAGTYMISGPLNIPSGCRIMGEAWSQLMAYGSAFADENNPTAMITVGSGEKGTVEMQNLMFTSRGALPGLVLVQWNIKAAEQGSAGMWDCHFRVGGAAGTELTRADCPRLSGGVKSKCIAANMLMLVTGNSNGYFENVWGWVGDHDIDFNSQGLDGQIDIFVGRGFLIIGDGGGLVFRGTASEHSVLYQYNIVNAKNVYLSIIQTESPYFQGSRLYQAPTPFRSPQWVGDPVFDMCGEDTVDCNNAWSLIVQFSRNIYIDGTGMYSWFKDYVQDCVHDNSCQQRLVNIHRVANSFFVDMTTIGAREMVTPAISEGTNLIRYAKDHLQATVYPWWATVATYGEFGGDDLDTTVEGYPIKEGWVAFGDSYAAGIGAGTPLDTVDTCKRGTGAYISILDQIVRFSHNVQPNWQPLACSGETAQQFLDGTEKGKQLANWLPESSDLATCSFTGNDLGFGDIVSHCIMGYKSRSDCQKDITNAKAILETNKVQELVHDVLDKIHAKAYKKRFVVYWTSYPKFFEVADTTCDSSYFQELIYAGEYLTTTLRNQLNELSVLVNDQIDYAIKRYNALEPYPKAVHVYIEKLNNIYQGHRFCEPGVKETLKSEAEQATVAFFYDNGYDDIPKDSEGFRMPPARPNAPSGWSIPSYNSGTCPANQPGDSSEPLDTMNCDIAKGLATGQIATGTGSDTVYDGEVMRNSDGTVSITDFVVRFTKMFHPKTRANWHIAQAVSDAFRKN
ncbi:LysM domain-containing protein [Paraphoma chrysanthemicola]|nr:LysM domain-containing protein [Paraphoma chrysanthemicola]